MGSNMKKGSKKTPKKVKEVVKEIIPEVIVEKTDGETIQEFLTEFNMTPERLCEEIGQGTVTLIKGIISGNMGLIPPFRNMFIKYMMTRKKRKAGL
jgi:hypothetical protein